MSIFAGLLALIAAFQPPPTPHLTQHEAFSVAVFAGQGQGLPPIPDRCPAVRRDVRICHYGTGERARVRELRHGFLLVRLHQRPLDLR